MNKHLVLVGMMGSGKTTVGRWLHERTGLPFADTDARIEKAEGRAITRIFDEEGEPYFRQKERMEVVALLAGPASVIATGGGLFLNPDSRRDLCSHGVVFYLRASAEELAERTRKAAHRPLLDGEDHLSKLKTMLQDRRKYYEHGTRVIDIAGRSVSHIGQEILGLYQKS